ncbi:MAG: hypothetical protein Kow0029_29120 [Candidatus Rifleibacteriota bacterium]
MREATDLGVSAGVRRELSGRRIDLTKLKFPVKNGVVTIQGEICFVGLEKTIEETAIELKFIESSLKSINGVKEVIFELTNWRKNDSGIWEPTGAKTGGTAAPAIAGEGLHCPDCDYVIRFCPCCGKPLAPGAKVVPAKQRRPIPPIKPVIRKKRPLPPTIPAIPTVSEIPEKPSQAPGKTDLSMPVAPPKPVTLKKEPEPKPIKPAFQPASEEKAPKPAVEPKPSISTPSKPSAPPDSTTVSGIAKSGLPPAPAPNQPPELKKPETNNETADKAGVEGNFFAEPSRESSETKASSAPISGQANLPKATDTEKKPLMPVEAEAPTEIAPEAESSATTIKQADSTHDHAPAPINEPVAPDLDLQFPAEDSPVPHQPSVSSPEPQPTAAQTTQDHFAGPVLKEQPVPVISQEKPEAPAEPVNLDQFDLSDFTIPTPQESGGPETSRPAPAFGQVTGDPFTSLDVDNLNLDLDDTPLPPLKPATSQPSEPQSLGGLDDSFSLDDDDTPLPPMKPKAAEKPAANDPFAALFSDSDTGLSASTKKEEGKSKDPFASLDLDLDILEVFPSNDQSSGAQQPPKPGTAPAAQSSNDNPFNFDNFIDLDSPVEDNKDKKGKKDPFDLDDFDISKFKI